MKISILTLFPDMLRGPFELSIIKNAIAKQLVEIELVNIRDFGIGKHKLVDDTPYGGGIGMVMRVDVLSEAIKKLKSIGSSACMTVLLSAGGKPFKQEVAKHFSKLDHLILICGHYEGVDERIKKYIDEEISVGDFVTTGGEIPAMLITDAVVRLIPGVLKEGATENESFSIKNTQGEIYIEYPQYTKPVEYEEKSVPDILLSGDHKKINEWRMEKALEKTKKTRPDLLGKKLK